jgi:hypothetical protein
MECCHHRDWDQEGGRLIEWYLTLANSPRMRAHPKVGSQAHLTMSVRNSAEIAGARGTQGQAISRVPRRINSFPRTARILINPGWRMVTLTNCNCE